ncbi:protein TOPLESS-like [Senna tora]|uniref:Protein TOPLESS-like n=1 Tax=Senna tora TaxID=362788 RepID=A0A834SY90_9FABA|nr:protein TOPLESS-like [Senna tora]
MQPKSLLAYVFYSCSCSSEVEAHDGNVNVIAFSTVNKQFFVITCGDDKIVKVWDVTSGEKCYTFDGQILLFVLYVLTRRNKSM